MPADAAAGTLRVILGDQLSRDVAALEGLDPAADVVLMAEVMGECTYVRHHKKKIAFVLSAMRHFAAELQAEGIRVDYRRLDDPDNRGSLRDEVVAAVMRHRPSRIVVTEPGEWRVLQDMETWEEAAGLPLEIRPDDRFIASRPRFAAWAGKRKQLTMEYFYRDMRKETGLLMARDGEPEGGQWNLDRENRKRLPGGLTPPEPLRIPPDDITREVLDLVTARFPDHFGDLEPFWFAVTARDAERAFDHFVRTALPRFGDYQDAMKQDGPTLYHAVAALYLNAGLLDPLAACRRVERAYRAGRVPLNAAEGFIRQVIGWREYVRGVYWLKMPDYAETNALEAHRPLPDFYWTGKTEMNCLRQCIGQTKREAYAHHIQRLMVTGNFALLAGIEPRQVCEWYLIVYADAYEWVELPNTHGMALFADGGVLGSKPYAASGKYIDRMSDYCRHCRYDVGKSTGKDACPFNSLYWQFLEVNRERLKGNRRMALTYRNLDRMDDARRQALNDQAARFLTTLSANA
ncbi:MAG: cryptochrome/photolyase family protein [Rhodospirillales bacterium]|nr:MAG: cryptochrome/photolyase family protein [Rhodospirillales bacterium]